MAVALLAKLEPTGPWRIAPTSGARDEAGEILHSDTWYAALTQAMAQLGWLRPWLEATAEADEPALRLSSLFFGLDEALLVPAPASLWPPPNVPAKLRVEGARYVPGHLVGQLAAGAAWNEDQWEVDGYSGCLLRRGRRSSRTGPYRIALRSHAAVDRLNAGRTAAHQTACIEWAEGAWLWFVAEFRDDAARQDWSSRLEGALRLLGDTGAGGKRHAGWGHFIVQSITPGDLPALVLGSAAPANEAEPVGEPSYWLLSAYCPGERDQVDWSRGCYTLMRRSGRVESPAGWGRPKKTLAMVREGSVLVSAKPPVGSAPNVAPEGMPHPVYRNGFAVALTLPWRVNV